MSGHGVLLFWLLGLALCATCAAHAGEDGIPRDDPAANLKLAWTGEFKWGNALDIGTVAGRDWDERLAAAQQTLAAQGGGVVYFPAGEYAFKETIRLKSGIVLRGAPPPAGVTALDEKYDPPTKFNFPQYKPLIEGQGTPVSSAFKGLELEDPAAGHHCGAVHLALNHAHIAWGVFDGFKANMEAGKSGKGFIIYGCALRNAAVLDASIPMLKIPKTETPFQEPWQRWTQRHQAAINLFVGGNALIAGNRLPASGEDNFLQKGYKLFNATSEEQGLKNPAILKVLTADVLFDYDNRPGISVNYMALGQGLSIWNPYVEAAAKAKEAKQEPAPGAPPLGPWAREIKPHVAGLAQGLVIRDNYVFLTGCTGIRSTGDGTLFAHNVIRFKPGVVLVTARGYQFDHFTNNNRAIEVRGWRWTMEDNDYEVHSNIPADGKGHYGDGEGLMHEGYDNCGLVESKLLRNKGNAYLCIWRVPVDGLRIEGNDVDAIRVLCLTNKKLGLPGRNIEILGNTTGPRGGRNVIGGGIEIAGGPVVDSLIQDNRNTAPGGKLTPSGAKVENNTGYEAPK